MTVGTPESRTRFEQVRAEWLAVTQSRPPDVDRFALLKREADAIIDAGLWVSGPADLLSVLGRHRDELAHSRLIAWLLTPTGRHGLGPHFLRSLLDHVWPGEGVLQSGQVTIDVEVTRSAADETGLLREARADIVVAGEGATLVIENKVDAGEGLDQCERLYWAWADQPTDTRWLFVSPTGRLPVTASSSAAIAAWRALSYRELQAMLRGLLAEAADGATATGRSTVDQYVATLASVVPR